MNKSPTLPLIIGNDELAQLEAEPLSDSLIERALQLTTVCWHLRQRDPARALQLADQAETILPQTGASLAQQYHLGARIELVRGEAACLFARLDAAARHAHAALNQYTLLGNAAGCADAHWLLAAISLTTGDHAALDQALLAMAKAARNSNDQLRLDIADAAQAMLGALRDKRAARQRWSGRFQADTSITHPALAPWVNNFFTHIASEEPEFQQAAEYRLQAHQAALDTGQIWLAIFLAANISASFIELDDHQSAHEWIARALETARAANWPYSLSQCLLQSAITLQRLQQPESARELLLEAQKTVAVLGASRISARICLAQADLEYEQGKIDTAQHYFQQLHDQAEQLQMPQLQIEAKRGLALTLLQLQQPQAAYQIAQQALAIAKEEQHRSAQIMLLQLLAQIQQQRPGSRPDALELLQQGLAISTADGGQAPSVLLDACADAYFARGAYQEAYQTSIQAIAARDAALIRDTAKRAIALQLRNKTERAQAENAYHRQMAAAEAQRAQILQQTSATLEFLSVVGQQITAHLDTQEVYQALNRHIHRLLDTEHFAIYLLDNDSQLLRAVFHNRQNNAMLPLKIACDDPTSAYAQCIRERREILHQTVAAHERPDSAHYHALLAPLIIAERIVGVAGIQTMRENSYSEREQMIFRTLCAYGAIALDNANAYARLKQTQTQLAAQEKLAALGSLVAGVAHELNTPISNSLMMASALQEKTGEIRTKLETQSLRHTNLVEFLNESKEACSLILRGLTSAADLVNSFKQVAVDRTSAQRRLFNLAQTSQEIIATMNNQIKHSGHNIVLDIPDSIKLNSYPGPYGQVITNFINNAMLHGFEGKSQGQILLSARQTQADRVQIKFQDNGCGIEPHNLNRIFDPFFTTKMGQGGSGLGLNICYHIVTKLLAGHLRVSSTLGQGTTFTLDLPLSAPPAER